MHRRSKLLFGDLVDELHALADDVDLSDDDREAKDRLQVQRMGRGSLRRLVGLRCLGRFQPRAVWAQAVPTAVDSCSGTSSSSP